MRATVVSPANRCRIEPYDLKPLAPIAAMAAWIALGTIRAREHLALGANLLVVCVVEIAQVLLAAQGTPNLWLCNAYLLIQVPLLAWLVWSWTTARGVRYAAAVAAVVAVGVGVFLHGDGSSERLLSPAVLFNGLMSIGMLLLVLFELASSSVALAREPRAWLAFAYLFYAGCTMPITGLLDHLYTRDVALASRVYVVHDVVYVVHYALLAWLLAWPLRRRLTLAP